MARTVYDVAHLERPWGWKVATYLWTKSIAAGVLLLAALGVAGGWAGGGVIAGIVSPALALVFAILTMGLLVFDLKRPDRFHYILLKPNWRSWLVWGAWILIGFGVVAFLWLVGGLLGSRSLLRVLAWPAVLLAAAAAGYSAFLFGQAEGRDFWQSPLLLWQLLAGALLAGTATLMLAALALGAARVTDPLKTILAAALAAQGLVLLAELFGSHPNQDVARAARTLTHGELSGWFWGGVVVGGIGVPLILLVGGSPGLAFPPLLALAGLWLYEMLWVRAGQSVPLS